MDDVTRMVKGSADAVRFESDAGAAAAVGRLAFPIQVSVRKPGYEAAYQAARGVLAQLEADTRGLPVEADARPVGIRFAHETNAVLVQVSCLLVVTLPGDAPFWPRAEVVARVLDVIHRYCEPAKPDKDVAVYTGPAGPAEPPPTDAVPGPGG